MVALPMTMRSGTDSASADSSRWSHPRVPGFVERLSTPSSGCEALGTTLVQVRWANRLDRSTSEAAAAEIGLNLTLSRGGPGGRR